MEQKSWREMVELASSYRAIGQTSINLFEQADYPWEYVTLIASGCTYRNGQPINVHIQADHPCGLRFEWICDLDDRQATGALFTPDTNQIMEIARNLPAAVQPNFQEHLRLLARSVRAEARGFQERANQAVAMAILLEGIAGKNGKGETD